MSAAAHGPVLTAEADGGLQAVELNYGGCFAHYDGHTQAGSCGNQVNSFNDCYSFECQACSDYANPSAYGPTQDCEENSISVGVCAAVRETEACGNEASDGGVATPCYDPSTIFTLWCGGAPSDAGPG